MEELEQILREHALRYPKMEPADAVKLIYQNEFGGGHLVKDEKTCLDFLYREYASVTKDPSIPLYDPIGNNIVRVNLAALEETALEQLGKEFIRSAAAHQGNPERFLEKLEVLCRVTERGVFAFRSDALKAYLKEYAADGYPIVSHSQVYRASYQPAYRIVLLPENQ